MKKFLARHSSGILSGLAIVGTVATAVLAVRATPKAVVLMEEKIFEKECLPEELTPIEIVKTTGALYIPAVACGLATIFCIIGANRINEKHLAAAIGACTATNKFYKDYRKKANDMFGNDTDRRIRSAMFKEYIDEEDTILIYDEYFDEYLTVPMDKVIFDDGLECYIINSRNLHDI